MPSLATHATYFHQMLVTGKSHYQAISQKLESVFYFLAKSLTLQNRNITLKKFTMTSWQ